MNIKYLVKDGSGDLYVPIYPFHQETYELAGGGPGSGSLVNKKLRIAVTVNIADESQTYTLLAYGYYLTFSEIEVLGERHTFPITEQSPFTWQFDRPGEHTFYATFRPGLPSAGSVFSGIANITTSISLPYGIETLPALIFAGMNMPNADVVVPSSVKRLDMGQFGGCTLHKLVIPKNCIVDSTAFNGCAPEILEFHGTYIDAETVPFGLFTGYLGISPVRLKKLIIDCRNTLIDACLSMPACEEIEVSGNVETISYSCFSGCSQVKKITLSGNKLKEIRSNAFYNCTSLTSITIPDNVTRINDYTFYGCSSLTSITIPNSVTSIGNSAFGFCTSITSCTIGSGVTYISDSAFASCTSLPVVDNIRYADTYAVEVVDKTLTTYTIKEGTKWIGNDAFRGCTSLTSIVIPDSVTSISNYAFYQCSGLTSITIPNSVTYIGKSAFYSCSGLTSVTIGNGVTSIGNSAFCQCSGLTSIVIPDSVTYINQDAFNTCTSLTSVTIGNGVTGIGNYAFAVCSSLTSIVSNAMKAPTIQGQTFRNVKKGGTLYVPQGSSGYNAWMSSREYELGKYNWTKVEQTSGQE